MRKSLAVRSKAVVLTTAAVTLATTLALAGTGSPAAATDSPYNSHRIKVDPNVIKAGVGTDAAQFSCQTRPLDGSQGARCYTPAQMQTAYGVSPLLNAGKNGAGRTIVIVDAYDNPYIQQDLSSFDTEFGLPDPGFTVVAPQGVPTFDPNDANMLGWAIETSLDVQWAHAIAPGAKIELVEAKSNQDADILAATDWAVSHNVGDVLSQSFGEAESCVDPALLAAEHQTFQRASNQGWTIFASSGDSGAAQYNCDGTAAILSASSPASDPLVTGVGGTTLNADSTTGAYLGETAWTEVFGCNPPAVAATDVNCSGGGYSTIYRKPGFQAFDVRGRTGRGVPDVAYNAGSNGGVLTHIAVYNILLGYQPTDPVFFVVGGTSAGTPQWAGLSAIADQVAQRRLGNINTSLYGLSHLPAWATPFHDITTGTNDVAEIGNQGYSATRGWDAVTGLGTPDASRLVPELAILGQFGLHRGLSHVRSGPHRK